MTGFSCELLGFAEVYSIRLSRTHPTPANTGKAQNEHLFHFFPTHHPMQLLHHTAQSFHALPVCGTLMDKGMRAVSCPALCRNYLITRLPSSPGKKGVEDSVQTMLSPIGGVVRRIYCGSSRWIARFADTYRAAVTRTSL